MINATGVWAGDLVEEVNLRPEPRHPRGAAPGHPARAVGLGVRPGARASPTGSCWCCPSPTAPSTSASPTSRSRASVPDVPVPTEPEIGFLLDVVSAAFARQLHRSDVVGAYAGLRPLLDVPGGTNGSTADLSRKHAVLTSTTRRGHDRRRQADDVPPDGRGRRRRRRRPRRAAGGAVPDQGAAAARRRVRGRCWPRSSCRPAWSAASAPTPSWSSPTPARSPACRTRSCWRPVADDIPATLAELVFGVTHEGAADVDDLLDRRTRIGLVPADRERAVAAAERALALAGRTARRSGRRLRRRRSHSGQPPMSFCHGPGLPL